MDKDLSRIQPVSLTTEELVHYASVLDLINKVPDDVRPWVHALLERLTASIDDGK